LIILKKYNTLSEIKFFGHSNPRNTVVKCNLNNKFNSNPVFCVLINPNTQLRIVRIKLFIAVILFFTVFSDVCPQWSIYQANTTMQLNRIQFVNAYTGFAAGGGTIDSAVFFKTTNAGLNWVKYGISDTIIWNWQEIYGLYFINENTGYVSGRYLRICKTTNGGVNWTTTIPPYYSITQIYNALYFIDENTGYAAGRWGYFCKTTNGGFNWSLVSTLGADLFGMHFTSANTGYVSAGNGTIFKTTNGGQNFTQNFTGPYSFSSIRFITENTGYVVGSDAWFHSVIYRTINGGNSWDNIFYQNNAEIYDVFFLDYYYGYASGYRCIFKTTNAGINWSSLIIPQNNEYYNIYFFNSLSGFISGGNGRIYKTSNGGVWINKILSTIPGNFHLYQNYPNPFNPTTKVKFSVPRRESINITIYDIGGRIIKTLVKQDLTEGVYETEFDAENLSSGIFFCKMTAGKYTAIRKMVFVK